ncbi:SET domain-containing protein [Schizophyllum commune Tattone D]|nr:SET domain-containing protein [Schizophyllum commune Tattone D]
MKRGFVEGKTTGPKGTDNNKPLAQTGGLESAGQEHAGLGPDWHVAAFLYATFDVDLHTDGPGHMKLSYGVVKEAGNLDGFVPKKLQCTELDATRLDHPDDITIQTTIPTQWADIEQHTAAERQDSWCDAVLDAATKREIFSQPGFPRPVPRPSTPAHRIAPAGAKGLGVFATRNIKGGELILGERPLLMTPAHIPPMSTNIPNHFTLQQLALAKMADWEIYLEQFVKRMLPDRYEKFMSLANSHQHDGSGEILGRIRTNAFRMSCFRYLRKTRDGPYSVVCDESSRFNHSCRPNATHHFDPESFSMSIYAARDIRVGEEMCVSYVSDCTSYEKRRENLAPYGIECTCEACEDHVVSDARRSEIIPFRMPDSQVDPEAELRRYLSQILLIEKEGLECSDQYVQNHAGVAIVALGLGKKGLARKYNARLVQLAKRPDVIDPDVLLAIAMASMMAT